MTWEYRVYKAQLVLVGNTDCFYYFTLGSKGATFNDLYHLCEIGPLQALLISNLDCSCNHACYAPRKQLHEQTQTTDTYRRTPWLSKTPNVPPELVPINPTSITANETSSC